MHQIFRRRQLCNDSKGSIQVAISAAAFADIRLIFYDSIISTRALLKALLIEGEIFAGITGQISCVLVISVGAEE
jgi:hypothetical protein